MIIMLEKALLFPLVDQGVLGNTTKYDKIYSWHPYVDKKFLLVKLF